MATRIYSLDLGENENDVVEDVGSATTVTFEFTFDLADHPTREDVLLALDKIKAHILKAPFPPA